MVTPRATVPPRWALGAAAPDATAATITRSRNRFTCRSLQPRPAERKARFRDEAAVGAVAARVQRASRRAAGLRVLRRVRWGRPGTARRSPRGERLRVAEQVPLFVGPPARRLLSARRRFRRAYGRRGARGPPAPPARETRPPPGGWAPP